MAMGEENSKHPIKYLLMARKQQMVDLQTQYLSIKDEIDSAIQNVLNSTAFIQGKEVGEFASALASHVKTNFVIPCANGTDALQIALMALDLQPDDEVIVPVHTYVATAEVIALLRLKPVFIDVNPKTFNIDHDQLESKITQRTKAIVPVHLYGQCCDMQGILTIARKHNIYVVEDAAQALGAVYSFPDGMQKQAGTMGIIGTTSFFPSKNLGCYGDGGALFTDNAILAEKIRMIANHGQRVKYYHDIVGVNSRLDTLQAAILNVKLKYLNEYTLKRNRVADFYDKHLGSVKFLIVPQRASYSTHVFHQYTIKVEPALRDGLKTHLENNGVPSMIYYPVPLHLQKAYRIEKYTKGTFPIAEVLSKTVLSLPIHTEMSEDDMWYIVNSIREFNG
jgi:UDP-2-acetamido-2-deoxy-ribo-hexuluronate aminotransferase